VDDPLAGAPGTKPLSQITTLKSSNLRTQVYQCSLNGFPSRLLVLVTGLKLWVNETHPILWQNSTTLFHSPLLFTIWNTFFFREFADIQFMKSTSPISRIIIELAHDDNPPHPEI
jgi:hypothetical protein